MYDRINHKDGLEIFTEDLIYNDAGIATEFKDTFKALLLPSSTGGLLRGFNVVIDPADTTKLKIVHSDNIYGIGQALNKNFEYIQSTTSTGLIDLASSSTGVINVLGVNYTETLIDSRINIVSGISNPTRIMRDWKYQVFTLADWAGALSTGWVELGRTTAQGIATPLISVDTTGRTYVSSLINNNFITEAMLNSAFRIYQTVVRNSQIYNDNFITSTGSQISLEDDLNQLRAYIKDIKGTLNYTDAAAGTLNDFDADVTGLHGNGVVKDVGNEFKLYNPLNGTGFKSPTFVIKSGKAIINGKVARTLVDTNIPITQPNSIPIIGEAHTIDGSSKIYLNKFPLPYGIAPIIYVGGSIISTGWSINSYATGEIAFYLLAPGTPVTVDYVYSQYRKDIVQISNVGVLSLKSGTQYDSTSTGAYPTVDANNILLHNIYCSYYPGFGNIWESFDARTFVFQVKDMAEKIKIQRIDIDPTLDAVISGSNPFPCGIYYDASTGLYKKASFANLPIGLYTRRYNRNSQNKYNPAEITLKGKTTFDSVTYPSTIPSPLTSTGTYYMTSTGALSTTPSFIKMGWMDTTGVFTVDIQINIQTISTDESRRWAIFYNN